MVIVLFFFNHVWHLIALTCCLGGDLLGDEASHFSQNPHWLWLVGVARSSAGSSLIAASSRGSVARGMAGRSGLWSRRGTRLRRSM
jgi:hypothetical protein